jgi:hypothetical protein
MFDPESGHVGFEVKEVALGQVFCEYLTSLATHSTDCSTLIIIIIIIHHPRLVQ